MKLASILAALGSSHTAFFHVSGADVPSAHAINATLRAIDTDSGKRWIQRTIQGREPAASGQGAARS